jgi:hypothetical protein
MNNALKLALDKGASMKMYGGGRFGVPTGQRMYVCMYVYISNGVESCLDSSCPAD